MPGREWDGAWRATTVCMHRGSHSLERAAMPSLRGQCLYAVSRPASSRDGRDNVACQRKRGRERLLHRVIAGCACRSGSVPAESMPDHCQSHASSTSLYWTGPAMRAKQPPHARHTRLSCQPFSGCSHIRDTRIRTRARARGQLSRRFGFNRSHQAHLPQLPVLPSLLGTLPDDVHVGQPRARCGLPKEVAPGNVQQGNGEVVCVMHAKHTGR